MRKLTLYPLRVHLDNLIDQLDRQPTFPLALLDLSSISTLVVDKVQDVKRHGYLLLLHYLAVGGRL